MKLLLATVAGTPVTGCRTTSLHLLALCPVLDNAGHSFGIVEMRASNPSDVVEAIERLRPEVMVVASPDSRRDRLGTLVQAAMAFSPGLVIVGDGVANAEAERTLPSIAAAGDERADPENFLETISALLAEARERAVSPRPDLNALGAFGVKLDDTLPVVFRDLERGTVVTFDHADGLRAHVSGRRARHEASKAEDLLEAYADELDGLGLAASDHYSRWLESDGHETELSFGPAGLPDTHVLLSEGRTGAEPPAWLLLRMARHFRSCGLPRNGARLALIRHVTNTASAVDASLASAVQCLAAHGAEAAVASTGQDIAVVLAAIDANQPVPDALLPLLERSTDGLRDRFCARPFHRLEVGADGVETCGCDGWMAPPASPRRTMGQLSRTILAGTFDFCRRSECALIRHDQLPRRADVSDPALRDRIEGGAGAVVADRHVVFAAGALGREQVAGQLPAASEITCDILDLQRLLQCLGGTLPRALRIHANSAGLTADAWNPIHDCPMQVSELEIEISAMTGSSARKLGLAGNTRRSLDAVEQAAKLRHWMVVDRLALVFSYEAENFQEMPDFVTWARLIGADRIALRRFGAGQKGEAACPGADRRRAVHSPAHPNHSAFRECIRNPVLAGNDVRRDFEPFLCSD